MSKKLQSDRLKKYQLKRQTQEQDERISYLSRLLKNKDESVFKLEEKAAKFEGEMHRIQEEYREKDNQRQRKFLRQRFDDANTEARFHQMGGTQNKEGGEGSGRQGVASKL